MKCKICKKEIEIHDECDLKICAKELQEREKEENAAREAAGYDADSHDKGVFTYDC